MSFNTGDSHLSDNQLVVMAVEQDDPLVQYSLSLSQIETVEAAFLSLPEPEPGTRYINSFEGWFRDHCMNRDVRPLDSLKEFQNSKSASIRQIATKVLAEKYDIFEPDKLRTDEVAIAKKNMWGTWAAVIVSILAAYYLGSCTSGKSIGESEVAPKSGTR
jgi:hypothetical protein